MTTVTSQELLNVPEAAKRLGMNYHKFLRLYERGLVPPAVKVGRMRLIRVEDLPMLKTAAKKAGYLK